MRKRLFLAMAAVLLTGCGVTSTPVAPPAPSMQPSPTLPDLGLPTDLTPMAGNSHVSNGEWGLINVIAKNGTGESLIGLRVNGIWMGEPGDLTSNRFDPAVSEQISIQSAVPYYVSYSYVVISGNSSASPEVSLLPTVEGTLYEITSTLVGGRRCPDQPGPTQPGLGRETRVCLVAISDDGARPTGLSKELADTEPKQYLFWDANDPETLPAAESTAS